MIENVITIAFTKSEVKRLRQLVSLGRKKAIKNSGVFGEDGERKAAKEIDAIERLLQDADDVLDVEHRAASARSKLADRR